MSILSSFFYKTNDRRQLRLAISILFLTAGCLLSAVHAQPVSIKVWDFPRWLEQGETTDRFTWISRKIREFEELNPDIRVELTKLTWQRGHEKLKIAAISGNNPDIAPGTVPLLFIRENLIEPINEYMAEQDRKDYLPGSLQAFTVKGKIYGWPWYMSGQLLYVNKDHFDAAKVDLPADGRWSVDEFSKKLFQLKTYHQTGVRADGSKNEKFAGKSGIFPLGLYFQKDETANTPFLMSHGGSIIDENNHYAASSTEFIQALYWINELRENQLIPHDSGGRTANDIWTAFGREHRISAAAIGLWGIKVLKDKFPMNFRVMHYPAVEEQKVGPFLGTSGFYVFKNSDPVKIAAAMKFAKFITNGENQKDLKHYSQFPTRFSTGNIYTDDQHMTEAWSILQEGQSVFADSRWPQIDEEFSSAVQESILDKENPEDAMQQVGHRIQRILSVESGSVREDINQSSWFAKAIAIISILAMIFAIISRQAHLIMIVPAVSITGLFLFYPLADAVLLAFRDYRIGEVGGFTIENFIRAFSDPKFSKACYNTIIYSLIVVPANVFTALVVASLIQSISGRLRTFFRAAYYLPGVASVVVLTMVWRWLFNTEVGLFNTTLRMVGMNPIGWLTDPDIAFSSVILASILKSPGGAMLIYLASMANIPPSLYESAELEGAGPLKKWWYITVPLLRGTTTFLMITGAIAALQVFAQVLMLTDGGPGISTQVVVHRIYTSAFRDFDFGLSAAMALILFMAIMIITLVQRKLTSRDVEYMA